MTTEQVIQTLNTTPKVENEFSIMDAAKHAVKLFNVSFEVAMREITDAIFGTVKGTL